MKLQSPHLADYLQCTPIIDWETPAIIAQTQAITRALTHDTAKAQALFEWVRDAIPHSWDIRTDVVTCAASEVLEQRTGLCYAKSHLLAAMLRCAGIPAGDSQSHARKSSQGRREATTSYSTFQKAGSSMAGDRLTGSYQRHGESWHRSHHVGEHSRPFASFLSVA
jgi:transglutaminase-like putative cysteine protease